MYLFFDTETNGLPREYGKHWHDLDNWPRMTQLAFILCDENGKELLNFSELIKPDGWEIPLEDFFARQGMTTIKCKNEGIEINVALRLFQQVLEISDFKVAHNISFDNAIVGSEIYRSELFEIDEFKFKPKICTMHSTTNLCQLPGPRGYKWPKLIELHEFLFKEGFEGAHDALVDVRAMVRCFFELKNKYGMYELEKTE